MRLELLCVLRRLAKSLTLGGIVLLTSSYACAAPVFGYTIVAQYPHSVQSYTEGLLYLDGLFYEGTGLNGHSALLAYKPTTGQVVHTIPLASRYFGEGIVDWGDNLYEWTWKSHVCLVYNRFTFTLVKQINYTGEGWGMTRTAKELITSDGTATLQFRDPETFLEKRHIVVHDGTVVISQLNELEFIRGEIYANIWHSDRIACISPKDGHVVAWIDLANLFPVAQRPTSESVLNGIAYDAQHDRLFVTGKQWPTIFAIKLVKPRAGLYR